MGTSYESASCRAHEAVMRAWSVGADEVYDPLPAECAAYLSRFSAGAPMVATDDEFAPGEGLDENGKVPDAELLRSVDGPCLDDSYRIMRMGQNLCVVFVQRCPVGHAVWSRIDLRPTEDRIVETTPRRTLLAHAVEKWQFLQTPRGFVALRWFDVNALNATERVAYDASAAEDAFEDAEESIDQDLAAFHAPSECYTDAYRGFDERRDALLAQSVR